MKRNHWHYIPLILLIALIFTSSIFLYKYDSHADKIKVMGDSEGLKITPEDTKMFDLKNLNPGDTKRAEITLENKYEDCYINIFLRTERTSKTSNEVEEDLFKQLELTVYLDEIVIYSGSMDKFASENKSLGSLAAHECKRMRAVVHLPGAETGNEFQGKDLVVNWIFTAEVNCPDSDPEIPKDTEEEVPDEEDLEEEVPGKEEDSEESKEEEQDQEEEVDEEDPKGLEDLGEKPKGPKGYNDSEELNNLLKPASKVSTLLRTGATPDLIYFGLGSLILTFGRSIYRNK